MTLEGVPNKDKSTAAI